MFSTTLHCTFTLHTQRGCLNSRWQPRVSASSIQQHAIGDDLGTFHPPQIYTVQLSLSYSTFSFSVFLVSQFNVTSLLILCSDFFNSLQELCSIHASVLILSILDSRGTTSYLRTSIKWFQHTLTRNKQQRGHFLTTRRGSGLTGVIYFLYVPWRIVVCLLSIPHQDLCYAIFRIVRHSVKQSTSPLLTPIGLHLTFRERFLFFHLHSLL